MTAARITHPATKARVHPDEVMVNRAWPRGPFNVEIHDHADETVTVWSQHETRKAAIAAGCRLPGVKWVRLPVGRTGVKRVACPRRSA